MFNSVSRVVIEPCEVTTVGGFIVIALAAIDAIVRSRMSFTACAIELNSGEQNRYEEFGRKRACP